MEFDFIWTHADGSTHTVYFEAYEEREGWPGGNLELWLNWDCDDYEAFVEAVCRDLGTTSLATAEDYVHSRLTQEYYEVKEDTRDVIGE